MAKKVSLILSEEAKEKRKHLSYSEEENGTIEVSVGFNGWGVLFSGLTLLVYGLWIQLIIVLTGVFTLIIIIIASGSISEGSRTFMQLIGIVIGIFVGIYANQWRISKLLWEGYCPETEGDAKLLEEEKLSAENYYSLRKHCKKIVIACIIIFSLEIFVLIYSFYVIPFAEKLYRYGDRYLPEGQKPFTWKNKDGQILIYDYKDDLYTGEYKLVYQNNKRAVDANIVNGKFEGEFKEYERTRGYYSFQKAFFQGKIEEESFYVNGKKNGLAKFYVDGKLYREKNYVNDLADGLFREYYPDGKQVEIEANLVDGFFEGDYKEYYANGKIKAFGFYKDQNLVSLKTYDQKGKETNVNLEVQK